MPENARTGTVKWYNPEKCYGFIIPSDGSKDVFVHKKYLFGPGLYKLLEGDKVLYLSETGPKGVQATKVWLPPT